MVIAAYILNRLLYQIVIITAVLIATWYYLKYLYFRIFLTSP